MRSLVTLLSFISLSAVAAPKALTTPTLADDAAALRNKALQESTSTGVKTAYASDAKIENQGLLSLKDPGLDPNVSDWKWELGLRAQNFTAGGRTQLPSGQTYDLSDAGSTILPIVGVGLRHPIAENDDMIWTLGGRLDFGYSSQRNDIRFPTGIKAENARLSTGIGALNLMASARFQKLPRVEFEAGLSQGFVSYTQAASDDAAHFSKQGRFNGWSLGVQYWVSPDWSLGIENARRDLADSSEIELQNDNMSIGTRVMW